MEYKRVEEICKIRTGKLDVNEGNPIGKYDFFTCAAIPLKSDTYSFDGEAILLPGNGANVGLTLYYNGKFEAYQRTYVLTDFKAFPKYVFYIFKTYWKNQVSNKQYGSATNYIRLDNIADFKIPIPDLATQKKVAGILEQADAAREKRKQANQFTEQFLQSAFIEMFGDPVKNEKKWEEKEIHEIVSSPLQNGAYYPKEKYSENGEGVEMIHMGDAFYGNVKRGEMRKVLATEKEIEKYSVDHNDVLIARRSLTFDGAAKPCMIEKSKEKLIFESSLIKITPNQKIILPIYLYYFFSNDRARSAYLLKSVTSSTISGINQSNLSSTKILVPSISVQQKFAQLVEQVEKLRTKQRESETELENLFQSLMQRYFG